MSKNNLKGFVTGGCLVASAVIFMSASESNSKVGKFQGFADERHNLLLDTETG